MFTRKIKEGLKKLRSSFTFFRIRKGLYIRKKLPEFDYNSLLQKWPYKDPCCIKKDSNAKSKTSGIIDLSIIIPMYNVESCVLTLLEQIDKQISSFTFEVLLVNDGSTDKTAQLVKNFIKGKDYYRYFDQENGGLSAARNTGIDNAIGDYYTFIDSDDEICEGFIENLISAAKANDADIVRGSYYLKQGGNLYPRGVVNGYAWGSAFRNYIFDQLRFPVGYWYEDMINSFWFEPMANKIIRIDTPVIIHNDTVNSLSKIQLTATNYRPLEHLYQVLYFSENYAAIGLTDMKYLQKRVVVECAGVMVNRIKKLDVETRMQVFLACNKLFNDVGIKADDFTGIEYYYCKAIINKDFTAWSLSSKVKFRS